MAIKIVKKSIKNQQINPWAIKCEIWQKDE
jgi:hypothetical protein